MSDGTLSEDSDTPEVEIQALVKAPKATLSSLKLTSSNGIYHTLMKEILKVALESHTEKSVNRIKGFKDGRDVSGACMIQKTIAKVRSRLDFLELSLKFDTDVRAPLAEEETLA